MVFVVVVDMRVVGVVLKGRLKVDAKIYENFPVAFTTS